jgi:hypothetical protein
VKLKPIYSKQVTPRADTCSFDSDDELRIEGDAQDPHQRRSSQLDRPLQVIVRPSNVTIENHSGFNFAAREDQHDYTRTHQGRLPTNKVQPGLDHHSSTPLLPHKPPCRTLASPVGYLQPRCRASPASGKHTVNHNLQDDALKRGSGVDQRFRPTLHNRV